MNKTFRYFFKILIMSSSSESSFYDILISWRAVHNIMMCYTMFVVIAWQQHHKASITYYICSKIRKYKEEKASTSLWTCGLLMPVWGNGSDNHKPSIRPMLWIPQKDLQQPPVVIPVWRSEWPCSVYLAMNFRSWREVWLKHALTREHSILFPPVSLTVLKSRPWVW